MVETMLIRFSPIERKINMKFYEISIDPNDGGPTIFIAARNQIDAKKAARKEALDGGWRVGRVQLVEIDQADMPKNAQHWVFG